jgi:hypothetical protein
VRPSEALFSPGRAAGYQYPDRGDIRKEDCEGRDTFHVRYEERDRRRLNSRALRARKFFWQMQNCHSDNSRNRGHVRCQQNCQQTAVNEFARAVNELA